MILHVSIKSIGQYPWFSGLYLYIYIYIYTIIYKPEIQKSSRFSIRWAMGLAICLVTAKD